MEKPLVGVRCLAPVLLSVSRVKLSGRAGRVPLFAPDVVTAIDQSKRTLMASGLDVDGDGILGRRRRIRRVVHYEQPEAETLDDRRNTAGLLVELRHRTREIGGAE